MKYILYHLFVIMIVIHYSYIITVFELLYTKKIIIIYILLL